MDALAEIRRQRIGRLLSQIIWPAVYPRAVPLHLSAAQVPGEPIPFDAVSSLEFRPTAPGESWGGMWSTTWFRGTGTVPGAFAGCHLVTRIDLGYEGGVGFGGEALAYDTRGPLQGVDPRHQTVEVTKSAIGGETVDLFVEAAANPHPSEGPLEWPILMPDYDGEPLYRLGRFDLAVQDEEMKAVALDWEVLTELADALGHEHPRSLEILAVLDDVARLVDPADPVATLLPRRGAWRPLLQRVTASPHRVTAAGHAHIDSAWLWPLRETRRKCARTFATALRLMEDNPDFVFVCSQAQQHAWIEEDHPALFEKMRRRAETGQFEPVGSMWVEPDTNLPSGESLVRQLVLGKRFFLERYGVETVDCWLPDAFGYSGNLPQILRSAGVSRFLTQKLSWNETNVFPHHTFWWEGIDGSRVLAHCPPTDTYNGDFTPGQLLRGERRFAQHGVSSRSLYAYGFGDGGGGPTPEMLERAARMRELDPLPVSSLGGCRTFFEEVERDIEVEEERRKALGGSPTAHAPGEGGLPVWRGEMYLERHRGVQTTQAACKLGNRRCEALLREAELWQAALGAPPATEAARRLRRAWETVLLHQFHDMLPGSSIHWVHADSRAAYAEVAAELEEVISEAVTSIGERTGGAGDVVVFNAATRARSEPVEVVSQDSGESDAFAGDLDEGGASRLQRLADGARLAFVVVPAAGWARQSLGRGRAGATLPPAVEAEGLRMWNGLLSAELDEEGFLVSLRDAASGREAMAGRGNLFQLHRDLPNHFDAWDVDQGSFEWALDQEKADSVELIESGPLRAAIRVSRPIGAGSRLVQDVRLAAGSRRVEFVTQVEWNERHSLLKVAFPVTVRSPRAAFEVPFGYVERATHANTSWDTARFEVPAQRWASLEEPGFGVALINDCKYGYDVRGNVLRLSLLRAPGWPDPTADAGTHRFSYALVLHGGGASIEDVVAEAEHFNLPLRVVTAAPSDHTLPLAESVVSLEGAVISAVKRADDAPSDLVVRFYEASGAHRTAVLRAKGAVSAVRVDALERPLGELIIENGALSLPLRPFEIVTVRLTS